MTYHLLADLVLLLHAAFVAFAVFGGLLALRYPRMPWFHLPALAWGVAVESLDWICPLTPLENRLRRLGGEAGYDAGFVEHYIGMVLYPESLALELRYLLAIGLIAVNVAVYVMVALSRKKR
ncbi:MAG TPA: DUF2784 domain-containing protein [Paucimonas sp.]|nr:DUF2784 domain-containing protein [Paucimonas sp.]